MHSFKYGLINEAVKSNGVILVFKRFKTQKVVSCCERALKHFDDFYKALFGEKWHSVRLGLLTKQKDVALINNFGEVEKTEKLLQNQGAIDLKLFFEVQKNFTPLLEPKKNAIDLSELMKQQLEEEKGKEANLYTKGLLFSSPTETSELENEPEENDNSPDYDPENPTTSLEHDLKTSKIETSRLILPDSAEGDVKLHEFIPATQLRGADSFVTESEYYKYYQIQTNTPFVIEEEQELDFPENLKVYTFDRGDVSKLPEPTKCINNVENFLKMDGADLLTALVLGVKRSDRVLDLCSTTASISYCLFQSLRPRHLVCANAGELMRQMYSEHLYESGNWGDMLCITSEDIRETENQDLFDKILVDVPCTNDRVSLFEEEDSIFHVCNVKKRLQLPELQCEFLKRGLRLVRPGGTVVYTTTTLSPVENDGVVREALESLWQENKMEFVIKDLTPALRHTSLFFNYSDYLNLKCGTLVVPFAAVNFGPRYICKIVKKFKQEGAVEVTPKLDAVGCLNENAVEGPPACF